MQVENSSENEGSVSWIEKRGVAATLACSVAFLVFIPTLGFQFVYDDTPQIIQNPAVHAWRYLPHYFTSHAWAELYPNVAGNYYRPLFLVWFRLNHAMFGLNPRGWHFTTILCHVAATYMVYRLLMRLAGKPWMAFGAALIFALHPVHMESVAWISGVTDPLLSIFLTGSFLAYLRYRDAHQWRWMAVALLLFSLGLLEKETMVVLGPLVFLYAWIYSADRPLVTRFASALRTSLAFFAFTALYLGLRAHVLRGLSHSVTPVSITVMALTEPSILWLYFHHLLFPFGLSGLYGLPYVTRFASAAFFVPTLLLAALLVLAVAAIKRMDNRRLALFACCWLVLPIVPVLFLRAYAEGDIAHDRYLYIPSVGFALLALLFIVELSKHWGTHEENIQLGVIALLAAACAIGTITQQKYWANDLALYGRAYQVAPRDNLICNDLGTALMEKGNPADAIALYSQVLAREPGFWLSNYNLGYAYYKTGKFHEAEDFLQRAISINATDSDEFVYLGLSVWRQGRADEALQYIEKAIQIRPSAPGYHFALAMILRNQNNLAGATTELKQELRYNPESAAAQQQLDALTSGAAARSK